VSAGPILQILNARNRTYVKVHCERYKFLSSLNKDVSQNLSFVIMLAVYLIERAESTANYKFFIKLVHAVGDGKDRQTVLALSTQRKFRSCRR